jgi:L-lysine exporter family protein LysE/ArgO
MLPKEKTRPGSTGRKRGRQFTHGKAGRSMGRSLPLEQHHSTRYDVFQGRRIPSRRFERFQPVLIEFLVSAFLLGVVVAIPPGSVTVVAVQRALQLGFRNSVFFSLGSACSDVFYLSLVWLGVAHLVSGNRALKIGLWFACGAILVVLGLVSIASLRKTKNDADLLAGFQASRPATFVSGVLVTLTNPLTIVGWIGVAGNFFLTWGEKYPASRGLGAVTIACIMTGVLGWFLPFTFVVSRLRNRLGDKVKRVLVLAANLILMAFGAAAVYFAVSALTAPA